MWGYQPHFRRQFKYLANNVVEQLGIQTPGAECLLVGARIPGRENRNDVCLEPEDGQWPLAMFNGLLDLVETEVDRHPLQKVVYGDAPSMRDKPENIRRDSVRAAVQKALVEYDSTNNVQSFAGRPAPVDAFHVVPVLQLPAAVFDRYRPLSKPVLDGIFSGHPGLIHAAMSQVLQEAHDELLRPDPGRFLATRSRSPEEIVRQAAHRFMQTPRVALKDRGLDTSDLFERFNMISSLLYEGARGSGRLLLANPESGSVDLSLELAEPVPFREPRWARKVLEMASSGTSLVADCEKIFGLGALASGVDPWGTQDVFEVEFLDHYYWRLSCGDEVMLISRYGSPSLPQETVPADLLSDSYQRLFPSARPSDVSRFIELFSAAADQRHGSTLVVAQDAEHEALRLQGQATRIEPKRLIPDLFRQVSAIDGAILVDPSGDCHAVGVILDGAARPECTPSRGSRYNSAVRYVRSTDTPRLAVVVSDDRTVDVIPQMRPRIKLTAIQDAIGKLESATKDNYHLRIQWLHERRFYFNQEQCDRINAALKSIQSEPLEVGEIRLTRNEFAPHPDFNDSYLDIDATN